MCACRSVLRSLQRTKVMKLEYCTVPQWSKQNNTAPYKETGHSLKSFYINFDYERVPMCVQWFHTLNTCNTLNGNMPLLVQLHQQHPSIYTKQPSKRMTLSYAMLLNLLPSPSPHAAPEVRFTSHVKLTPGWVLVRIKFVSIQEISRG